MTRVFKKDDPSLDHNVIRDEEGNVFIAPSKAPPYYESRKVNIDAIAAKYSKKTKTKQEKPQMTKEQAREAARLEVQKDLQEAKLIEDGLTPRNENERIFLESIENNGIVMDNIGRFTAAQDLAQLDYIESRSGKRQHHYSRFNYR